MKLPLENRWDLSSLTESISEQDKQSFWNKAYQHLKRARNKVAAKYNASHRQHMYKEGDTVVYKLNIVSNKANRVSAKFLLRWSKPVVIARVVRPNVVLLANPETGVIVRKAT
jgi:hypothetical protein